MNRPHQMRLVRARKINISIHCFLKSTAAGVGEAGFICLIGAQLPDTNFSVADDGVNPYQVDNVFVKSCILILISRFKLAFAAF